MHFSCNFASSERVIGSEDIRIKMLVKIGYLELADLARSAISRYPLKYERYIVKSTVLLELVGIAWTKKGEKLLFFFFFFCKLHVHVNYM